MKLAGREMVHLPRSDVWRGLNDPDILKTCISGCDYFKREEPLVLRASMVAKLGFLKVRLGARILQSDVLEPVSCRLDVTGEGPIASLGRAIVHIRLEQVSETETNVGFDVEAQLGGRLAGFGQSLVDTAAQGYVRRFFERFEAALRQA